MFARTAAALGSLTVLALPLLAVTYPTGAPPNFDGYSNACTACHSTYAENSGTGSVSVASPDRYAPGQPVTLTVTIVNTTPVDPNGVGARQGFELGVRNASGESVGSFDLGTSGAVQFAQGNPNFVTHTEAGNQQTSWTFDWIPPTDTPPEVVTIYVAGNAANGDNRLTADYIYTQSKTLALSTADEPGPDERAVQLGAVSPQPVRSAARASLTLREPGEVRARLVDGLGRTVRDLASGAFPAGESSLAIDASGLSAGVYFLVVETPQGRRTARVVISR